MNSFLQNIDLVVKKNLTAIFFNKMLILVLCGINFMGFSFMGFSQKKIADPPKEVLTPEVLNGLKFRSIGPAFQSGRIADFAINPTDPSEYYVAVACGNVWKTTNAGTTYTPIFDNYGSYSIANVVIDPNNTKVVWVGTGEYNSQRAIGYGDGIYRSEDGGKSFKNMGLKNSEHIGRIYIDPRNSHIYVAVQGPLWGSGGDRGLYKSIDNGTTWQRILFISDNTGINDIVADPRNPDIIYISSYQRRRHVYTLINGGPEGAIYKSIDAGKNWSKLSNGIPSCDIGRIGLTISPVNPDIIYAIIEAEGTNGGFFRSIDRGVSWDKMSAQGSTSPQYYHRIFADPKDANKVYSVDTYTQFTLDGGKTFQRLGLSQRHVDDHALWIDPANTKHLLIGGDGGIYQTYDAGETWEHKNNLPVTQFYRVQVDNSLPFYFIYGGTQDNNSAGGPSRTISELGIPNDEWFVTQGGDGFFSQIDPVNPNIVYAEAQHGGLVRYDRKSTESVYIQPQPPKGEAYRWNWNSPLMISPHSPTRLYFAANKLFRSDDRGDSWKVISPDLTRQLDRNQLPVFGKIQSPDAVAKNASTSLYGNIVSLDESAVTEGLIYVGTDDGLIQVTEDAGQNWTKYATFPGIPDMTYISCLLASSHKAQTVYAAFDARKQNNLKPYLLVSSDKGKTWKSIASNLPERGTVYSIVEDYVNPDLLFVGTEFGIYTSIDGGQKWIQLKAGLPTTAIYDIKIQKRENDLVIATFGRGFYILDDFTPLRELSHDMLSKDAKLFKVKDALMFIQQEPKYGQGATYYNGQNPPVAATFTYYLKEGIKTRKEKRKKDEKEANDKGISIKYPTMEELRAEDQEEEPYLLFTVTDETGNIIRRLKAPAKAGIGRITWNFRYPSNNSQSIDNTYENKSNGPMVLPGVYKVSMATVIDGVVNDLPEIQTFNAITLNNTTLPATNRKELVDFHRKVNELQRNLIGTSRMVADLDNRLSLIKLALYNTESDTKKLLETTKSLDAQIMVLDQRLNGDKSLAKRYENQPASINEIVNGIIDSYWRSTSAPTKTMKEQYTLAGEEYDDVYKILQQVLTDVQKLEASMEELKSPWTPGRLPVWKR